MDKDEVMDLNYSESSADTPFPMKSKRKLFHLIWWRYYTVSLKSYKIMSNDEWMKQTQYDYEAIRSKQVTNIAISGEGQLVAVNKTTYGPSASYYWKGHNWDMSAYASYNGNLRYWFCEKQNWLSDSANNGVSDMISKDYVITADVTTTKYLFDAMNCYVFILEMCAWWGIWYPPEYWGGC